MRVQRHGQRHSPWPVLGFGLIVRLTQPGVEDDESALVRDGVPVNRLDPHVASVGLLRWTDERTQVQPPDIRNLHDHTVRTPALVAEPCHSQIR